MKVKLFGGLLLVLAVLVGAQSAFAALNAYMYIKGQKSGLVKGSVTQRGREESIMVIAYSHNISVPIDTATGTPKGKYKNEPLKITKEIDQSSPILYNMLVTNENITELKLQFWQPSASGKEVQHFTITLTNARIISIKSEMLNNKYPENMQHKERERIFHSPMKISVGHGTMAGSPAPLSGNLFTAVSFNKYLCVHVDNT